MREAPTPERPYPRLVLHCQHHGDDCSRRRNCSDQQTTLGEREPFAFLAVWHRKGAQLGAAAGAPGATTASTLRERHSYGMRVSYEFRSSRS